MAKVIRDKDYVIDKRKKAVLSVVLWGGLLAVVFFTGLILNKGERASYFTVLAALMSLPVAQHLVAVVAYTAKNKSFPEIEKRVLSLPKSCSVYINNIAVTEKGNIPINYIIASSEAVFILADFSAFNYGSLKSMESLWIKKGIDIPVEVVDTDGWDNALNKALHIANRAAPLDDFYETAILKLLL